MYDSAAVSPGPVGSFSQSNIYRLLQRRLLGLRLALTGRFRCERASGVSSRSLGFNSAPPLQVPLCVRRSGGRRWKPWPSTCPPVSPGGPSPPPSASGGGSAGVQIPQDRKFLAPGSRDPPRTVVSPELAAAHPGSCLLLTGSCPLWCQVQVQVLVAVLRCGVVLSFACCRVLLPPRSRPSPLRSRAPVLPWFRP